MNRKNILSQNVFFFAMQHLYDRVTNVNNFPKRFCQNSRKIDSAQKVVQKEAASKWKIFWKDLASFRWSLCRKPPHQRTFNFSVYGDYQYRWCLLKTKLSKCIFDWSAFYFLRLLFCALRNFYSNFLIWIIVKIWQSVFWKVYIRESSLRNQIKYTFTNLTFGS